MQSDVSGATPSAPAASRAWVKPRVRMLEAGKAEIQLGTGVDGTAHQS
jgi:hypothetical protein